MQVGVCTISAKSQSVESILDRCGDLPVDGVEIWGEDHVGDGSPERCREIAAAAEANGLAVPVYGSYLRPGTGTFDEDVDRELAIADRLGADVIRVWAGEQEYEDCEPAHWDRVVADLERLGTAAGERGLAVTVERHSGSVTNATAGARELIEQVDAPAVGLNWQPLFEHDAVSDAAVIPSPDDEWGETPKAFVVPSNKDPENPPVSPEELTEFTQENLANYKTVRRIEYVEELPTTATGKIQKFELREQEWEDEDRMVGEG